MQLDVAYNDYEKPAGWICEHVAAMLDVFFYGPS